MAVKIPKGRLYSKGSENKPICKDCAIYFSIAVNGWFGAGPGGFGVRLGPIPENERGLGYLGLPKSNPKTTENPNHPLSITRWWLQTFVIFTPIWGNDPI